MRSKRWVDSEARRAFTAALVAATTTAAATSCGGGAPNAGGRTGGAAPTGSVTSGSAGSLVAAEAGGRDGMAVGGGAGAASEASGGAAAGASGAGGGARGGAGGSPSITDTNSAGDGGSAGAAAGGAGSGAWIQLFNGVDLSGWTPKFAGSPVGVNYKDTFRVVNGTLVVSYDQYSSWNGEFGHLFHKSKFSHYVVRAEYRFVGKQVPGGVSWGYLNNGIMIHCQSPESMALDQQFPVGLEVKLFGDDGSPPVPGAELRTSGKVCTPGTDIRVNGKLTLKQHCVESSTFHHSPNEWVTIEAEVMGNTHITHRQNGIVTAEYTEPQLDPNDPNMERVYAKALLDAGAPKLISEGYIAIQSETHPTEFRKIELMVLP